MHAHSGISWIIGLGIRPARGNRVPELKGRGQVLVTQERSLNQLRAFCSVNQKEAVTLGKQHSSLLAAGFSTPVLGCEGSPLQSHSSSLPMANTREADNQTQEKSKRHPATAHGQAA